MFKRLYDWTLSLAGSPRATPALAAVSFAESSFFPIPPDVILIPMALARPERAYYYAAVCTVASVLGGIVGYAIGYLLYETVGQWLMNLYGYAAKVESLRAFYADWGWAFILVKGATPIPFKLVTIVSGLLEYNFPAVSCSCARLPAARGSSSSPACSIAMASQARRMLDNHFGLFMGLILFFIVFGFWLALKVI